MTSGYGAPGRQAEMLKKAQAIRYSDNWTVELRRLLGAYAYFMTNRQHARGLWNMDQVIRHIASDLVPDRIFQSFTMKAASAKLEEQGIHSPLQYLELLLDGKRRKALFRRYAILFRSDYGSGESLDGKFSYNDLRPRVRPRPEDDVVYINRHIKFFDVWAQYDYQYLVNKIRFVTTKNTLNAAGFPVQIETPLFSFNDKNIMRKWVNVVPFVYWAQNERICTNRCIDSAKYVELIAAFYLHMEGYQISGSAEGVGPGAGAESDEADLEQMDSQPAVGYDSLPQYEAPESGGDEVEAGGEDEDYDD